MACFLYLDAPVGGEGAQYECIKVKMNAEDPCFRRELNKYRLALFQVDYRLKVAGGFM